MKKMNFDFALKIHIIHKNISLVHNMKNQKILIGLKKAKTSLEKIIEMVEEDKYCIDIIQQNLAVIWLLKSANINLLEWHVNCCVKKAAASQNEEELEEKMQELIKIIYLAQNK